MIRIILNIEYINYIYITKEKQIWIIILTIYLINNQIIIEYIIIYLTIECLNLNFLYKLNKTNKITYNYFLLNNINNWLFIFRYINNNTIW